MPEQNVNAVPITESSSRPRHPYAMAALVLTLGIAGTSLFLTNRDLLPLQRFYLLKYALAATNLRPTGNFTFAEVFDHGQLTLAVPEDVATDDNNHLVLSQAATDRGRGPLYFTPRIVATDYFYNLLHDYVFHRQSPADLLDSTRHLTVNALLIFLVAGLFLDWQRWH